MMPQIWTAFASPCNVNYTRLQLWVVRMSPGFAPNFRLQHPNITPPEFCYSGWNQPFAPSDRRTAEDMIRDERNEYCDKEKGLDKIRKTLLRSWSQVDEGTRV